MELRKDWSLAHFLLYICQIGYWLIVTNVVLQLLLSIGFVSDNQVVLDDIPVHIELQQFEEYNDVEASNVRLNIPDRMESKVQISGSFDEVRSAYFFYNGLKLYESAVFFIILFMLSKVLKSVADGKPFESRNPFYLYVIGWTLIISSVINLFIQFIFLAPSFSLPVLGSLSLPENIKIPSLNMFGENFMIAGIFIIVLGYVFKEGTRIYNEQKLTV